MVFDIVKRTTFQSIAVIISHLTSLMQDQVKFLTSIGASAIKITTSEIVNTARKTASNRFKCVQHMFALLALNNKL